MDDIIKALNDDITALQNRIKYEQNKGRISNLQSGVSVAYKYQKEIGLSLLGIEDIANSLDPQIGQRIMRRVIEIRSFLSSEVTRLETCLKEHK